MKACFPIQGMHTDGSTGKSNEQSGKKKNWGTFMPKAKKKDELTMTSSGAPFTAGKAQDETRAPPAG
jgi:hypothetical protein